MSKLKGIGNQGDCFNELNIHTVFDSKEYLSSFDLPKVKISGLDAKYESALKALPGKTTLLEKDHRK